MGIDLRVLHFVYETGRAAARVLGSPIVPPPFEQRDTAFRKSLAEAIHREWVDPAASPEEQHARWVEAMLAQGWRAGSSYDPDARTHPSLVPFEALSPVERAKDVIFREACVIARILQQVCEQQEA